jgi:putative ABC transport system permease protein
MRKTFLKKGLREIWAHKFQYFFLVLVLGLGIASYGSLYDMGEARGDTLKAIYEESRFMDVQVMIEYGQTINISSLENLLADPAVAPMVKEVEYRLTFDVFLNHTEDGKPKTTRGQVMGYNIFDGGNQRELAVNQPLFFVDDPPDFSSPDARECYLESHFAKAYEIDSGESLTVVKGPMEYEMEVLRRVNIPEYFFVITPNSMLPSERSLGILAVPIETAMELYFGGEDGEIQVNDMVFLLNDGSQENIDEFEEIIKAKFEDHGFVASTMEKAENPARRFLYDDYENDKQNVATFPIVIFTVASFGLVMTLRRMIRTHRAQIGIFKSLGVPNRVVLTYFLTIGLLIAIFGTIMGGILSIPMRLGFLTLIDSMLGFAIVKSSLAWPHYLVSAIIGFSICLIFTFIPAWLALRIKPVDAIQTREGISKKKAGRLATQLAKKSKMPVPVKLTFRNLLRKPGRTATTVLGVGLSLSLFLSFMIVLNSVVIMIDESMEVTTWDYEITMDGFTPHNVSSTWTAEYEEIDAVNPGILLPTYIWEGDTDEVGIIYALNDVERAYKIEYQKGELDQSGLVISTWLSKQLGVSVGDSIEAELPTFDPISGFSMSKVPITISGIHNNHIGVNMFMDLSAMQSLTGLFGMSNVIYLHLKNGNEIQPLENRLITTPGVSSVTFIDDRENVLDQYFEIFVGTVYIMGLISVILSSAIVYNLFMIDAHEKKRDYATMKTLGTSLRRIGYLIFIESTVVLVIGVLLGALGGMGLAYYMFAIASEWESLNLRVVFTWAGFIGGAIMIAAVIYVVSLVSMRFIKRINIADVIRERSY